MKYEGFVGFLTVIAISKASSNERQYTHPLKVANKKYYLASTKASLESDIVVENYYQNREMMILYSDAQNGKRNASVAQNTQAN